MKSVTFLSIMYIVAALTVSACNLEKVKTTTTTESAVLANVNGSIITEDDRYLALEGEHGGTASSETRERVLQDLIDQELLYQKGLELNLDKDAKFRNAVRVMEMRLRAFKRAEMARRVVSTRIAASVNIADEDVRSFYEQNTEMIATELHLYILRFSNEQDALAAQTKLVAGQSIVQVAAEADNHGRAPNPWDAGFLRWDQVPIEWANQLYKLKKGEISPVLTSKRTGICVVQLIDKRSDDGASLERMSARIMNRLRDIRIEEAYDRYLSDLRSGAKITRNSERRNAS